MPGTDRAYERPSRISQGLVVCLSIAVVLMAGWLAVTIMLSQYATISAVGDTAMTRAPAYMENVSREPDEPRVMTGANSVYFEPLPRDDPSTTPTSPRSAPALAPFVEPPPAATRLPGPAPSSTATAMPDANYRSIPAPPPYFPPRAAEEARASIEATDAIADLMRLPPAPPPYPPPRAGENRLGAVSIPMPRPRPRLEAEDVQPGPDQSFFDLLLARQR